MKEKPTLCFLRLEDTAYGGAENYLRRAGEALDKLHIPYHIMHSTAPHFLASWIKALYFNAEARLKKKNQFYFSLSRITSADIYRAGDGVHRVYMKVKKAKWWENPAHFVYCYLERRCFQKAKKIIANSLMVKNEIIESYQIPDNKIKVIYNGVSLDFVDVKSANFEIRQQLNIPLDKKIILFVGSGFKRKGLKCFLEILSSLKNDFVSIIIGKDKKIKNYQKLADSLHLSKKIIFLPQQKNINDYYAASDIFFLPTLYDPFANVTLEAMALENAIITSSKNGAAEILNPTFVMNENNKNNIVKEMENLLSDENYLKKTKRDNFQISQRFSIEKNVEETLKVIQEVMRGDSELSLE